MPEGSISVLLLLVFSFGSHAAANMAFGLVFLQNGFDLLIKLMVCQPKPLGNILMFRRYELEWYRPGPDHPAGGDRYPHSHPCPLRFFE